MSRYSRQDPGGDNARRAIHNALCDFCGPGEPWETGPQRRRRRYDENTAQRLRFAVSAPADQTYVYVRPDGMETTEHPEAALFRTREEADAVARAVDWRRYVEEVRSVREFRSREDTL